MEFVMSRLRLPVLALSVGAVLLAGACSSSSASAGSGTPAAKGAANGGAANGGKAAAGLPSDLNICTAVPLAQISSITGGSFDTAEPDNTPSYGIYACNYTGTKSFDQLRVDVIGGAGGPAGYDADKQALTTTGHTPTDISGVGDKAFSASIAGSVGEYDALFGSNLIKITGGTAVTTDQAKQIFTAVAGKLGS
jgi:hypothetical protein